MKYKYKNLIPFVLIIFMAAAWYQIIRDSVNTTREYNGYVPGNFLKMRYYWMQLRIITKPYK